MDEKFLELASELEERQRLNAIALAARPDPRDKFVFFDGVHCVEEDCGDEIPAARRALGKFRCVACQTMKETRRA